MENKKVYNPKEFEDCVVRTIKIYYKVFDLLYKDYETAKKIEEEWFPKAKMEKVYAIVECELLDEPFIELSSDMYNTDFEKVEMEFAIEHARKCKNCGQYFEQGYVIGYKDLIGWGEYYCEGGCLYSAFNTFEEFEKEYEEGHSYWTTFFQ